MIDTELQKGGRFFSIQKVRESKANEAEYTVDFFGLESRRNLSILKDVRNNQSVNGYWSDFGQFEKEQKRNLDAAQHKTLLEIGLCFQDFEKT